MAGETAEDLARQGNYFGLASALGSTTTALDVSMGDVFAAVINDRRPVQSVEWFTLSMPGVRGAAGIKHSTLAFTVGSAGEEPHKYMMEKASVLGPLHNREQFKNGVFVSNWNDSSDKFVNERPIHALSLENMKNNSTKASLCMRTLREIAVELGPYHVATCNCHHMAMAVYNACAKQDFQVQEMPNATLTSLAVFFAARGLDLNVDAEVVDHIFKRSTKAAKQPDTSVREVSYNAQSVTI
jgi:hypothetical protein